MNVTPKPVNAAVKNTTNRVKEVADYLPYAQPPHRGRKWR